MSTSTTKIQKRNRRQTRIRSRAIGTEERPRLSVFKSNKQIYAQVINDATGRTLAAASTKDVKGDTQLAKAKELGGLIAKRAVEGKVKTVVFDRGGFVYTGKIKALADAARAGGLTF